MAKTIKSQILDFVESNPHVNFTTVKKYIWENIHKSNYPFIANENRGWYSNSKNLYKPSKNDPRHLKNISNHRNCCDLIVVTD